MVVPVHLLLVPPHNGFIMRPYARLKETLSQSERRLAAIMYTDIEGYTALTQGDEPLAMKVLETHRRLIRPVFAKHSGREVKTMGDAFLLEFDSALQATECAAEIQKVLRAYNETASTKVSVRIGVHAGDIIHREGDVYGDAVNIASRIVSLATGGEVCISEQVYDQVHNKVPYRLLKLGPRALKNVSFQTDVYKVELPWQIPGMKADIVRDRYRVAILPLVNLSNDPKDEYFADGMTEEIITTLSNISGLTVISRTSAMQYKGAKKNLVDIGRELGAGTLLEGSVRKEGNRVRITVQLLDASEDKHLWAQSYDRELQGIFAVQSDVATNIADALKVRLLEGEAAQIKKKHSENIEAYTLYLKGRFLWNKRNKEGVLESLKLFQEAIKMDPDYARAYSGLADAYTIAAGSYMDWADGLARSKEAALKALELDETLAEAHASLGINLENDLRFEEAQREFRRAIELNPSYATAHHWYCICLQEMGRMKEAMEEIEKARGLDPLSPIITNMVGYMPIYDGRLDEAIAIYDKLIADEPTFIHSYANRAYCFALKGMKEKAYADLEAWGKLRRDEDRYKATLAVYSLWFGERERASSIIEELISRVGGSSVWETTIATCYAILGNRDEFFTWIDKAISAKRIGVAELRSSPIFDKVRDDPRFPEIFKKLGLPY